MEKGRSKDIGYCVAFSNLYLHLRMSGLTREQSVQQLMEGGQDNITTMIRSYAYQIDTIVPDEEDTRKLIEYD